MPCVLTVIDVGLPMYSTQQVLNRALDEFGKLVIIASVFTRNIR